MTKNRNKRYPVAIDDLLIEFYEMDYAPTNLCEDPEKEAIAWKDRLRYELDLLLDEKSAIERRAVKEFAEKLKKRSHCDNDFMDGKWHRYVFVDEIDELLKEYRK